MDNVIIEPKKGIGIIQLGMTKAEVDECLQIYTDKYETKYEQNPQSYHMKGFIQNSFTIEYDSDGKAGFISISSSLKEVVTCLFHDFDVFQTKAEKLVEKIDKLSKYDRDHWELGWTYDYPELGLSFWRPNVLKEADLQEDWFKQMPPEIQEDEKKNLYFECASIRCV